MLLLPVQRGKRKRILGIVKKYPNLRSNHRNNIAKMRNEICVIFTHNGVVDYHEMYKVVKKMNADKRCAKYRTQLSLIEESITLPKEQLNNNMPDKNRMSLYVSIAGLILTIIGILVSIITSSK